MPNEMPESGKIWHCEMCGVIFHEPRTSHGTFGPRESEEYECGPIVEYTRADISPEMANTVTFWLTNILRNIDREKMQELTRQLASRCGLQADLAPKVTEEEMKEMLEVLAYHDNHGGYLCDKRVKARDIAIRILEGWKENQTRKEKP